MECILKKYGFEGSKDFFYKKVDDNLWLEFDLKLKNLYITDGTNSINLKKPCSTQTELDETLKWYFNEPQRNYDFLYLLLGSIIGVLIILIILNK